MGNAIIAAALAYFAFKYLAKPAATTPTQPTSSEGPAANEIPVDNMLKNPIEVAGTTARPPESASSTPPTQSTGAVAPAPISFWGTRTTPLGTSYPVSAGSAGTSSGAISPAETRDTIVSYHKGEMRY